MKKIMIDVSSRIMLLYANNKIVLAQGNMIIKGQVKYSSSEKLSLFCKTWLLSDYYSIEEVNKYV